MLRKAEQKDIPRIAEIIIFTKRVTYRPIFNNDHVSFNVMQVMSEAEGYAKSHGLDDLYVYDDGIVKAIVKYWLKDGEIEISDFYVDWFFQHLGLGTKILDEIFAQGYPVSLYVLDKNEKAIKFYEKYGFSYCNEKKEFENSGFFMLKYAKNAIK